jgi:hypothetical protein
MEYDMTQSDARLNEAFRDLARRASAVDVNHGPHQAGGRSRFALGGPGRGRGLVPALAFAVLAAIAGFGGWQLLVDDGPDSNIATTDDDTPADDDGTDDGDGTATTNGQSLGAFTAVSGAPDDAFVLVEVGDGTEAGFPSVLNSWVALPPDARGALPDGEGGVFYVTNDAVVHQDPGGVPVQLATAERAPRIVAARTVDDRPAALIRVDNAVVAFFADGSRADVMLDPDRFDGAVEEVAIDGSVLAAVTLDGDGQLAVQLVSLTDGSVRTVIGPLDSEAIDAPIDVALAGDRLVVGTVDTVNVYSLEADDFADPIDSFPMPGSPDDSGWWSFDGAGDADGARLIINLAEAALTIDLETGDRAVVPGVTDWVRSAHWADAPDTSTITDPLDVAAGDRYRVDTDAVEADRTDPFLNVRSAAGAGQPLVAKLPPTYRGLRATGRSVQTADGATWLEFELLHPVRYTGEVSDGGFATNPTGWVNGALTVALPDGIGVGLDEVPGCFQGEPGRVGGGLSGEAFVYGLESRFLSDSCLRVVLTVGAGQTSYSWSDIPTGTGPASGLPSIIATSVGSQGSTIDLGQTRSAWPRATETDDGVYVVRGADGNLELVVPLGADGAELTSLPELGVVVIDLSIRGPAPMADRLVVLTEDPLIGAGSVSVVGIARPFEASLGVALVDADDEPVTAVFSGSAFLGTMRSDQYAVETNDWTDAWGRFALKVDGLDPGQYTLLLDGEGGIESPSPTRISFTVTTGPTDDPSPPSEAESAVARALVSFARGGSFADLPLADEVTLGLGLDEQQTRSRAELADRDNWTFDATEGFGGFVGPFNVLDTLSAGWVEFSAGPMNFCAAPPKIWPADWQALDQVNIEPVGIDSCIAWYGISLFLNGDGEIEVVVLDLFGP